jgi:hypothetical protein
MAERLSRIKVDVLGLFNKFCRLRIKNRNGIATVAVTDMI